MNWGVAVVAFVAAVAPFAQVRRLRVASTSQRLIGSATVLVAVTALAVVAGPVLDALDISEPTMVIAAGLTLALTCAVRLLTHRSVEPLELDRNSALLGITPVAFPVLLTPIVGVMALAAAGPLGVPSVPGLTAIPLAMLLLEQSINDRAAGLGSTAVATAGIVAGVALTVDGIYTV